MQKALKIKSKISPVGTRAAACLALLAFAASCVPSGTATRPMAAASIAADALDIPLTAAPPPPEPLALRPVAPETAVAMNAAIPVDAGYNPAARPFSVRAAGMIDRTRSLDCLATAVYYEAASESDDGQRAVAQVVLNRVRHPTYPNSVCGVVYQGSERTTGCQFSFTCDGSLARTPSIAGWARARRIAAEALAGKVYRPVGLATHYHTQQVLPYWAASLTKSAVIGAHIFYRWTGSWGTPAAFRQSYAGTEPVPGPKPRAAAAAVPPAALLQAEVTSLIDAGRQLDGQRLQPASTTALRDPIASIPEVTGGPSLPKSDVREAYRYSGMPLDQVPVAASEGR